MEKGLKGLEWWEINSEDLVEPREAFTEALLMPARRSHFECRRRRFEHGEPRLCRERYFDLTPPLVNAEGKLVRVIYCEKCGYDLRSVGLEHEADLIALGRKTL